MAYPLAGSVMGRPMGLAERLFPQNQFLAGLGSWVDPRRNTLAALGAGLASGTDFGSGVAKALQLAVQGRQADDAYATQQKAEAQRRADLNKTVEYLRQAAPQYADAVQAGVLSPSDAYRQFLADQKGAGPQAPITVSAGSTVYDPNTNQPLFTAPTAPEKPQAAPSGYRWAADGSLEFIPHGPADPSVMNANKPPTEAVRRNQQLAAVMVPEVQSLFGDEQHPGTFSAMADLTNQAKGVVSGIGGNLFGPTATSPEYQQAQDSIKTIVASYLYSVSGATANPGEVANQVDVLTPKPGDSPQRLLAKKARIQQMVQAVVDAAKTGNAVNDPGSGGATAPSIDDLLQKYL